VPATTTITDRTLVEATQATITTTETRTTSNNNLQENNNNNSNIMVEAEKKGIISMMVGRTVAIVTITSRITTKREHI
jgi:hypothetical protein